ncbi:hypothetical protein [Dyadobacter sp. BHUBP1]|uniref:hypothetical protein n=1 Tax=Dyadobacter sp. BHUBP1 TaxID=3424178 RepID=UPI003D3515EB
MASFKFPKANPESLRAMAYAVRNELSGGIAVDDNRFSLRQIETSLRHMAVRVQKEEDYANELLGIMPSPARSQVFACIPLTDSTDFDCKCTHSGARLRKAVLPKMYQWRGQSFLSYVGATSMELSFIPVQSIFELNALAGEVEKPLYFSTGSALYVLLPSKYVLICQVTVIGIPEDPTATSGSCFDVWSEDWPVPAHIKAITKDRVLQSLGNNLLATVPQRDIRNNANHGNQFVTTTTP